MAAPSVVAPTMAPRVITQMDPIELSFLNELLDRIAALGVAIDYDRVGLKPDQRDIRSPPATHEIAVVEEPHMGCPSTLRTNYVRITELSELNTHPKEDMAQVPDLESGIEPKKLGDTPNPELSGSELLAPLGVRLDQNPDSAKNTH